MKLQTRVKPPKIGDKVTINGSKFVVKDWRPIIGYSPKRWMLEVQVWRKVKK